jgi:hypothetical protein
MRVVRNPTTDCETEPAERPSERTFTGAVALAENRPKRGEEREQNHWVILRIFRRSSLGKPSFTACGFAEPNL